MGEAERLRFLQRALQKGMLSREDYEQLLPRMRCSLTAFVAREREAQESEPSEAAGKKRQELAVQLAQCVIDALRYDEPLSGRPCASHPPSSRSSEGQPADGCSDTSLASTTTSIWTSTPSISKDKQPESSTASTSVPIKFAFPMEDTSKICLDPLQVTSQWLTTLQMCFQPMTSHLLARAG